MVLRAVGLALLVAAVGFALALVLLAESCRVGAKEPGEPPNEPVCERALSPVGLGITALLAGAAVAAFGGRAGFAWAPWALATAVTTLFGLSHGTLLYPCALALAGLLLVALAGRRAGRRGRAPAT